MTSTSFSRPKRRPLEFEEFDMNDYSGKLAVVTGGGSGLGRATARLLASRGARVIVADLAAEAGQKTADGIAADGGEAAFMPLDVADPKAVEALFASVGEAEGRLDVLVNCAGIATTLAPIADYPIEDWHRAIDINLNGTFYCIKYAIPLMLASGGGAIVTMSSIMGSVGNATASAYCAGKHALVGITKSVAQEYADQGVRINAVAPGVVETPLSAPGLATKAARDYMLAATPAGRFGEPEEIAALIAFLCSDEAQYITGGYYPIDGGYLTR